MRISAEFKVNIDHCERLCVSLLCPSINSNSLLFEAAFPRFLELTDLLPRFVRKESILYILIMLNYFHPLGTNCFP